MVYHISFLKGLPPSCMTSASHTWHIQSSGSSLTIFSPVRCIFIARFPSIVELCPQTFLLHKPFVQSRVIGHKQQKSVLSTKADGGSNGRGLLAYEWQGKPECRVRRQGSRESGQLRAWPDLWSWDPRPLPLQQVLLALDTHPPPRHRTSGPSITSTVNNR